MEGEKQGYEQGGQPPSYGYDQGQPQGNVQGGQPQGQPQGYVQGGQNTVYIQGGQAGAVTTTTVVTIANPGQGIRDWTYGLFGCFNNCGICCLSYCLPCFVVGKNAEELGDSCMLYGLLSCLILPIADFIVRRNIRAKLNIAGSDVSDCLVVFCCPVCAITQERREVLEHLEMVRQ